MTAPTSNSDPRAALVAAVQRAIDQAVAAGLSGDEIEEMVINLLRLNITLDWR
ncbi:MAG: hypothetical protein ACXVB2_12515 [Isosphaeraceae bacterium]